MKKEIEKTGIGDGGRFYSIDDSTKIASFLQIPKLLFSDEHYSRLSLLAKMTYSLYLNRYTDTSYKDEIGPYIVFKDEDIAWRLDTTTEYIRKIRRQLKDVGLIDYRRGISVNKIYIYSYTSGQADSDNDRIFFYENQLDSWRFYRFPSVLFEEKYINLPLASKFLYAMYFDMLCLSQAHNFTDEAERIYFKEGVQTQEVKSNFTANTIRKYRRYLQACGLLYEFKPFAQEMRYYLVKLEMYEDNNFMYENMTADEQDAYLGKKMEDFKKTYILKSKSDDDVRTFRDVFKKAKMSNQALVDMYAKTGHTLSVNGLRKYFNGSRRMPEEVRAFLIDTIKSDPAISQIYHELSGNDVMSLSSEKSPSLSLKGQHHHLSEARFISNTDKNNNKKYTDMTTSIQEEVKQEASLFIDYLNDETLYLTDSDIQFIRTVINDMAERQTITTKRDVYSSSDIHNVFHNLLEMESGLEYHLIAMLNEIRTIPFSSPQGQVHYFEAMLLSRHAQANDWWQTKVSAIELQKYMANNYRNTGAEKFSDDIKDLKWWEM